MSHLLDIDYCAWDGDDSQSDFLNTTTKLPVSNQAKPSILKPSQKDNIQPSRLHKVKFQPPQQDPVPHAPLGTKAEVGGSSSTMNDEHEIPARNDPNGLYLAAPSLPDLSANDEASNGDTSVPALEMQETHDTVLQFPEHGVVCLSPAGKECADEKQSKSRSNLNTCVVEGTEDDVKHERQRSHLSIQEQGESVAAVTSCQAVDMHPATEIGGMTADTLVNTGGGLRGAIDDDLTFKESAKPEEPFLNSRSFEPSFGWAEQQDIKIPRHLPGNEDGEIEVAEDDSGMRWYDARALSSDLRSNVSFVHSALDLTKKDDTACISDEQPPHSEPTVEAEHPAFKDVSTGFRLFAEANETPQKEDAGVMDSNSTQNEGVSLGVLEPLQIPAAVKKLLPSDSFCPIAEYDCDVVVTSCDNADSEEPAGPSSLASEVKGQNDEEGFSSVFLNDSLNRLMMRLEALSLGASPAHNKVLHAADDNLECDAQCNTQQFGISIDGHTTITNNMNDVPCSGVGSVVDLWNGNDEEQPSFQNGSQPAHLQDVQTALNPTLHSRDDRENTDFEERLLEHKTQMHASSGPCVMPEKANRPWQESDPSPLEEEHIASVTCNDLHRPQELTLNTSQKAFHEDHFCPMVEEEPKSYSSASLCAVNDDFTNECHLGFGDVGCIETTTCFEDDDTSNGKAEFDLTITRAQEPVEVCITEHVEEMNDVVALPPGVKSYLKAPSCSFAHEYETPAKDVCSFPSALQDNEKLPWQTAVDERKEYGVSSSRPAGGTKNSFDCEDYETDNAQYLGDLGEYGCVLEGSSIQEGIQMDTMQNEEDRENHETPTANGCTADEGLTDVIVNAVQDVGFVDTKKYLEEASLDILQQSEALSSILPVSSDPTASISTASCVLSDYEDCCHLSRSTDSEEGFETPQQHTPERTPVHTLKSQPATLLEQLNSTDAPDEVISECAVDQEITNKELPEAKDIATVPEVTNVNSFEEQPIASRGCYAIDFDDLENLNPFGGDSVNVNILKSSVDIDTCKESISSLPTEFDNTESISLEPITNPACTFIDPTLSKDTLEDSLTITSFAKPESPSTLPANVNEVIVPATESDLHITVPQEHICVDPTFETCVVSAPTEVANMMPKSSSPHIKQEDTELKDVQPLKVVQSDIAEDVVSQETYDFDPDNIDMNPFGGSSKLQNSPPLPRVSYNFDPEMIDLIDPFKCGGSKLQNSPPSGRKHPVIGSHEELTSMDTMLSQPVPPSPCKHDIDISDKENTTAAPPEMKKFPQKKARKPITRTGMRKKVPTKKAPALEQESTDAIEKSDANEAPKRSYTLDFTKLDDPVHPFVSCNKLPDSPKQNEPCTSAYTFNPDDFNATFDGCKSTETQNITTLEVESDCHADERKLAAETPASKSPQKKKKSLNSRTFRVKSPKNGSPAEESVEVFRDFNVIMGERATDEEKLASSVPGMKATPVLPTEAITCQSVVSSKPFGFAVDEEFRPASEVAGFDQPIQFDYLEQFGSASTFQVSALRKQSLYLKFDPLLHESPQKKNAQLTDITEVPSSCGVVTKAPTRMAAQSFGHDVGNNKLDLLGLSPLNTTMDMAAVPMGNLAPNAAEKNPTAFAQCLQTERARIGTAMRSGPQVAGAIMDVCCYTQAQMETNLHHIRAEAASREEELRNMYDAKVVELADVTKILGEYEKTIMELIEEGQREKAATEQRMQALISEREQASADVVSLEKSLADLFRRNEKLREAVEGFRKNEETLKKCTQEALARVKKEEQRYQALKAHAEEKLEKANEDIAAVRARARAETVALQASQRMDQVKIQSLEMRLEEKIKENEELTKICDELIKMGKS
uniref:uncharacterized protein isoform X2 n=1 Tax=Myxine glutinosa TaxID=7769 RepID=UPI00358FA06E